VNVRVEVYVGVKVAVDVGVRVSVGVGVFEYQVPDGVEVSVAVSVNVGERVGVKQMGPSHVPDVPAAVSFQKIVPFPISLPDAARVNPVNTNPHRTGATDEYIAPSGCTVAVKNGGAAAPDTPHPPYIWNPSIVPVPVPEYSYDHMGGPATTHVTSVTHAWARPPETYPMAMNNNMEQ
jgi:hypothetical protein